jgi:hypothetical protein
MAQSMAVHATVTPPPSPTKAMPSSARTSPTKSSIRGGAGVERPTFPGIRQQEGAVAHSVSKQLSGHRSHQPGLIHLQQQSPVSSPHHREAQSSVSSDELTRILNTVLSGVFEVKEKVNHFDARIENAEGKVVSLEDRVTALEHKVGQGSRASEWDDEEDYGNLGEGESTVDASVLADNGDEDNES